MDFFCCFFQSHYNYLNFKVFRGLKFNLFIRFYEHFGQGFEHPGFPNVFYTMKKIFCFLLLSASYSWAHAQTATVVKFDRIEKIMKTQTDEVQVINFWATWCAPCVKELPLFEKLGAETPGVKVTLVNLDFADKVEKVNAFMARKNIKSETVLLDEVDYNTWIDKVDASWQGAIPATLIVNTRTGTRKFVERELADGELQQLVASVK